MEELAGLLELGRIARPQPLVDAQKGALVVGRGIFLKRLEDELLARVLDHLDGAEVAGVGQNLGQGLGDGRAAVDEHLAGGRIDDVPAGDSPLELGRGLGVGRINGLGLVEGLEDGLVGRILRAHGAEERHRRELARLVDPDAQRFLLGDLQFDPASPLGNDPAGVQLLVARFDLDHEIDPGRAVELADDHALGAVDDELAAADHDRHVAEIDRLLEHRLALVQAEPDVERAAEGQPELAALVGIVPRLAQVKPEIFQLERLVVALDREDLPEDAFQSRVGSLFGGLVGLEETLVAVRLDLGQIGNRKLVVNPAEIPFPGRDDAAHGGRSGHVVALLKGRKENQPDSGVRPGTRLEPAFRTARDLGSNQRNVRPRTRGRPDRTPIRVKSPSDAKRGEGNVHGIAVDRTRVMAAHDSGGRSTPQARPDTPMPATSRRQDRGMMARTHGVMVSVCPGPWLRIPRGAGGSPQDSQCAGSSPMGSLDLRRWRRRLRVPS